MGNKLVKLSEKFVGVILFKAVALLVVVFLIFTVPLSHAHAAFLLNFGGRVLSTWICTCPAFPGMSVTVGPPNPGQFFWSFYTTIPYQYYYPKIGDWIKGQYYAGSYIVCWQISTTGCTPGGPGGLLMNKFGNSLK